MARYARASSHRNWMFTAFKRTALESIQLRLPEVKYVRVQEEYADTTGGRHWQGFITFFGTKTFSAVKLFLNEPEAHIKFVLRKEEALNYALKTETQGLEYFEYGLRISTGVGYKALDKRIREEESTSRLLTCLAERIDNKMMDIDYVYLNLPKLYEDLVRKYPRFKVIMQRLPLKVLYIWGKGGLGKTEFRRAFAQYLKLEDYLMDETKFCEGITSDIKILGIDEFTDDTMAYTHFNSICDNLHPRKPVKNSSVLVDPDFLLVTSNSSPRDVYPRLSETKLRTFLRRIDGIMHVEEFTATHNKITLTIINHFTNESEEHVFICPIRRPTNIPQCNSITKTFVGTLVRYFMENEETLLENRKFVDEYKKYVD